ncbi:hypothetical protein CFAM422_001518 [Trichoderma lentiforme]|uniref:Uncharacterized protein n=1 Tax=Trichoderma lentiforme TaxID=1567552 RepID=A0A9P4XQF7_9HYPO|nr:hypothetical protein CFAM422_001518 [Trichoderma lentiforme]
MALGEISTRSRRDTKIRIWLAGVLNRYGDDLSKTRKMLPRQKTQIQQAGGSSASKERRPLGVLAREEQHAGRSNEAQISISDSELGLGTDNEESHHTTNGAIGGV